MKIVMIENFSCTFVAWTKQARRQTAGRQAVGRHRQKANGNGANGECDSKLSSMTIFVIIACFFFFLVLLAEGRCVYLCVQVGVSRSFVTF